MWIKYKHLNTQFQKLVLFLLYPIHQILISYILNEVIGALSVEKQLFQLKFSFKGVHDISPKRSIYLLVSLAAVFSIVTQHVSSPLHAVSVRDGSLLS